MRDERTPERYFTTAPFRRSPYREAYEGLRIILCKFQAALMLARPYIEKGAVVHGSLLGLRSERDA